MANQIPALLDHRGNPIKALAHEAASRTSSELATWAPPIDISADDALLPELSMLRSRTHDMIRNHGIASGAVQIHLDNIIGSGLQLNAKPNWLLLGLKDQDKQAEWEQMTEAKFADWWEDIDCYCDAGRRLTGPRIMAQAYRSYLCSFEILSTAEWLPNRGGKYATAIQNVDPARLSNPFDRAYPLEKLREGIEIDDLGGPVAYHIASSLANSAYLTFGMRVWKRIPARTPWGRKLVLHHFDAEQPGQTRGKHGIVSVLAKLKSLERFEQSSLQAAILNAMYAAVIESSLDWQAVGAALGVPGAQDPTAGYMANRADFHKEGNIRYNGVKIPHLFPGEQLKLMSPNHPSAQFSSFEEAVLRYVAAGTNLTYEQLSRDYSKTNYSSARAAMLESWKFFTGRHAFIAAPYATDIYALWLEEAMDKGEIEQPPGTPDFLDAKSAWCGCEWIGPGRGHIDPEKENNADKIEYGMFLTTLEELAARRGKKWDKLLEQRAQEKARMEALGLDAQAILDSALGSKPMFDQDGKRVGNSGKKEGGEGSPPAKKETASAPVVIQSDGKLAEAVAAMAAREPTNVQVHVPQSIEMAEQVGEAIGRVVGDAVERMAEFTEANVQAIRETAERVEGAVSHVEGAVRDSTQANERLAERVEKSNQAVIDTLHKPVMPVKDKNGKTIGAQRVDNLKGE